MTGSTLCPGALTGQGPVPVRAANCAPLSNRKQGAYWLPGSTNAFDFHDCFCRFSKFSVLLLHNISMNFVSVSFALLMPLFRNL